MKKKLTYQKIKSSMLLLLLHWYMCVFVIVMYCCASPVSLKCCKAHTDKYMSHCVLLLFFVAICIVVGKTHYPDGHMASHSSAAKVSCLCACLALLRLLLPWFISIFSRLFSTYFLLHIYACLSFYYFITIISVNIC